MRYLRTMKLVLVLVFFSAACTRTNPASTCASGSCSDPAFPYCDSSGAIGGTPDECISVQCTPGTVGACKDSTAYTCDSSGTSYTTTECMSGCDPTTGCKHACEPSAAISCINNEYVACNADGTGMISETCVLGCSSDAVACQTFVPSHGLGPALLDAGSRSAMTIPAGARIDTDTGVIQDTNGTTIPSYSVVVQQNGASAIRVFEGSSFEIQSVSISGNNAVAFVAPGLVDIAGLVQARANGSTTGPGSQKVPAACAALDSTQYSAGCGPGATGAGGWWQCNSWRDRWRHPRHHWFSGGARNPVERICTSSGRLHRRNAARSRERDFCARRWRRRRSTDRFGNEDRHTRRRRHRPRRRRR